MSFRPFHLSRGCHFLDPCFLLPVCVFCFTPFPYKKEQKRGVRRKQLGFKIPAHPVSFPRMGDVLKGRYVCSVLDR